MCTRPGFDILFPQISQKLGNPRSRQRFKERRIIAFAMVPLKGQDQLLILRKTADYQFGKGVGEKLFPRDVICGVSKKTGRMRSVHLRGEPLATINHRDGRIQLSYGGALALSRLIKKDRFRVRVLDEISSFVESGGNVFSRHVVFADEEILPGEEVIVENLDGKILAVGKAILCGKEMGRYKRGMAVKVRRSRL